MDKDESAPDAGLVAVIPLIALISVNSLPKLTSAIPSPPKMATSSPCVAISSAMAAPSEA